MYRLLALDLDGTLLNPRPQKIITPRTRHALQQAMTAGVRVVIATGQNLPVLKQVCAGIPIVGPQIIENGAQVIEMQNGFLHHEYLLPAERVLPILTVLQQEGFSRAYHARDRVYADIDTPRVRQWYRPPVLPVIEMADVATLFPEPCIKIVGVGEENKLRDRRPALIERFAGQAHIVQSAYDLLEFLHPTASKELALRTIAQDLRIPPEEIIAVGDGHNDIGMLRFAGLGVAMGNAHAEVKHVADHITASNAEDGVAAVIERFILSELL